MWRWTSKSLRLTDAADPTACLHTSPAAAMPDGDEVHPIASPFLYVQLQPRDARPTLDAAIRELAECTPFRFHHHLDSQDAKRPHFKQIEFQQLETAQKAYATVQHVKLRYRPAGEDTPPVYLSLSVNEDPVLDTVPPEGTLLHVSELPVSYCSPGPLYALFKTYGPIYHLEIGPRLGTARVTYYSKASSKAAEEELHFSELDGMSIIVRKPSIHDGKDSFKSSIFPNPVSSRRTYSASSPSSPEWASVPADSVKGTPRTCKKTHNYASGPRATCGVGPVPYGLGLSAAAEPFTPQSALTASASVDQDTDQLDSYGLSGIPFVIRSPSQPIQLVDPCRLILQNVPWDLNAQSLFVAMRNTFLAAPLGREIKLLEATVASDTATGASKGIAFIRLENKAQADAAAHILDKAHLAGYNDRAGTRPMEAKLFEPTGQLEKALTLKQDSPSRQGDSNREYSTNPRSCHSATATSPSIPSDICKSLSKRDKHRNLLSTALDDLDLHDARLLYTSTNEKQRLLDLLVDRLPKDERNRCILDERYLKIRCEALKVLFMDGNDCDGGETCRSGQDGKTGGLGMLEGSPRQEGISSEAGTLESHESESRLFAGGCARDEHASTEPSSPIIPDIPTTSSVTRNLVMSQHVRNSAEQSPFQTARIAQGNDMSIETLVTYSVKGIIDLACSSDPPALLEGRNEEIVKSVDAFLTSMKSLKVAHQKQKIGEKVFKVFKNRAAGMKHISRKTVALLDTEDLGALMHLTEEFPDILIAKAMAIEL